LYLDFTILTQLPATMGNLKQLQNFIVNDNKIEGELPAWLADMDALEVFYINNNKLSGCYETFVLPEQVVVHLNHQTAAKPIL